MATKRKIKTNTKTNKLGYHHKKTDLFGTYYYNEKNQLHRTDGTAIEYSDGNKYWYVNDQLHRTDGPAYEGSNGTKKWWVNGQFHRMDGPAYEGSSGTKEWWVNDQLHRTDGPAIEYSSGNKSWYVNGKKLTEQDFNKLYPPTKPKLKNEVSDEEIMVIKLKVPKFVEIEGILYKLVKHEEN